MIAWKLLCLIAWVVGFLIMGALLVLTLFGALALSAVGIVVNFIGTTIENRRERESR